MRATDPLPPTARPLLSTARVHVVGLVLLALLLQALSPLLHARLQAMHAALTGQRIDVAAYCLPGHVPQDSIGTADGAPLWPMGRADCQLCQGAAPPAADMPLLAVMVLPPTSVAASVVASPAERIRVVAVASAHRPRGPPPA